MFHSAHFLLTLYDSELDSGALPVFLLFPDNGGGGKGVKGAKVLFPAGPPPALFGAS